MDNLELDETILTIKVEPPDDDESIVGAVVAAVGWFIQYNLICSSNNGQNFEPCSDVFCKNAMFIIIFLRPSPEYYPTFLNPRTKYLKEKQTCNLS